MLYEIFFDSKCPVLQISVPTGRSSMESLTEKVFLLNRRPLTGVSGIKLLHDKTPAHKSATVQEYMKESGLNVIDHPPYSPDLFPVTFFCSQDCKEILAG
jgi:transposase